MACSLRGVLFGLCLAAFTVALPLAATPAAAAEMDKNAKSDAKLAMRFYKEGNYEDAAKIFVRLSVAYPDMLVFVRNLGACYYYMRRYEPALSNLRDYEHRKKDMEPDDRAEVAGWIGELERMRDQALVAAAPPAAAVPAVPPVAPPAAVTAPTAPVPAPAGPETTQPAPASQPPVQAIDNAIPVQEHEGAQSQPAYPPGQVGVQPQPGYPQVPYSAPPQVAYPQDQVTQPQPGYPPGQYGAQPGYPVTQYPPVGGGNAPAPSSYPQGGYAPAGVAAPAAPPPSGGGGRTAAAWILGITGVGGLAAGGVFTALALDRFSKVQRKYDPTLEKQGKDFAIYQWIGYGSGAALLTIAIIVGSGGSSSPPAVALSPVVGPGAAGATLSGSF
jgi:hypothetical protein